jgi:hypothetical protein
VAKHDDLEEKLKKLTHAFVREVVDIAETLAARRRFKQLETGELITVDRAAEIESVTPQAARKRCQEALEEGFQICAKFGVQWLIYTSLWLDDIERRKGRHARLQAESRAKNILQSCADAPEIDE